MALRKKLLKLDKNEVARKCKKKHLSTMGTKGDMVDRLVEYDEEHGGVTGAREGSNKKKKKSTGGGGGGGGGRGGRSGGRANTRDSDDDYDDDDDDDNENGCYCNCVGGDNNNNTSRKNGGNCNKQIIGGIVGIICLILFVIALIINTLSRYDSNGITISCRWNEVRGCNGNNNCLTVSFKEDCDECNGECNGCNTKQGGQWWLIFNILSLFILLIGVIGVFSGYFTLKAIAFEKWIKVFYIIPAIFSFLAVISWVSANDYDQSCYDTHNNLNLGASNIIDIISGVLLIIGFILVL
eukprot:44533_1